MVKVDHRPGSIIGKVLDRCLVGRLGGPEGHIAEVSRVEKWVAKEWKEKEVELVELGGSCVGFIFPTRRIAEKTQTERWVIGNHLCFSTGGHRWFCAIEEKTKMRPGLG